MSEREIEDGWPAGRWWEEHDLMVVFTAVIVAVVGIAVAAAAGLGWARFIFLIFHYVLIAAFALGVLALLAAGIVQAWAQVRNVIRRHRS